MVDKTMTNMLLEPKDSMLLHDEALTESVYNSVEQRFKENPSFRNTFKGIRYHFHDGSLYLDGTLPSYYLKQVLQFLLIDIEGVKIRQRGQPGAKLVKSETHA